MLVIVSIVYCVCWLPDLTMYLLHHYGVTYIYIDVPSICGIVLVTCNSVINPFIYTLQSEKFRLHLKELVCCRKVRRNRVAMAIRRNPSHTTSKIGTEDKTAEHSM
jgi:hypothetical protein